MPTYVKLYLVKSSKSYVFEIYIFFFVLDEIDYSEPVCAGCLNVLDEEEVIPALEHKWHLDCFRCSACDASLSNWYFEKDGLLFCKDDYLARYGESCQHCTQVILLLQN